MDRLVPLYVASKLAYSRNRQQAEQTFSTMPSQIGDAALMLMPITFLRLHLIVTSIRWTRGDVYGNYTCAICHALAGN